MFFQDEVVSYKLSLGSFAYSIMNKVYLLIKTKGKTTKHSSVNSVLTMTKHTHTTRDTHTLNHPATLTHSLSDTHIHAHSP